MGVVTQLRRANLSAWYSLLAFFNLVHYNVVHYNVMHYNLVNYNLVKYALKRLPRYLTDNFRLKSTL